jgi:acyl-CoA dehydrogenase
VSSVVSLIILLGLFIFCCAFSVSSLVWSIIFGLGLISITFMQSLWWPIVLLSWLAYGAALGFSFLTNWRQKTLALHILPLLRKRMPAMSNTEKEAIEAGNTWWERKLFSGNPNWQELFAITKAQLTAEEQSFLNTEVDALCQKLNDWNIVYKDHDLSPEVWGYLKQQRFFGLVIPKQYGGRGFSALAHSAIITKIASRSVSAAVNTMVPNSLGPAELLLHYGTDSQKDYYLPRLATGEDIPCFALTGPEAGSDAGSITDKGIVGYGLYQGQEVLGIHLTWNKRYITLAPIATVLGIAFKLYDPKQLLGDRVDIGITLCLIPTSHPGVEIGTRHLPMHLAFMNGPTRGNNVFIPIDWIIGGQAMAGQGWRMLMECLSIGRAISLPALATAGSQLIYRLTGAYAALRQQFKTELANFDGVKQSLGTIAAYTYLLEASRQLTANAVDQHIKPSIASAIAKYHMTEMARTIINHAMDIHAGHMVQVGPRNFLAHLYISAPISITVEGANILTRNLIIFGQGAIRCHPFLLDEMQLINTDSVDIKALDTTLMKHIGFAISNIGKSLWYGLSGGYGVWIGHCEFPKLKVYLQQLTRISTNLALLTDIYLLKLGGNLKRKEAI